MTQQWTRDDLPDRYDLQRLKLWIVQPFFFDDIPDAVVAHLNAHHPKPSGSFAVMLEDVHRAQLERDRLRRAHEIVEGERDQARASLREACKVAQSYKVDAYQATERADAAVARAEQAERDRDDEKAARREAWKHLDKAADRVVHEQTRAQEAERERDEWKARAEAAETRTAPAVTREEVISALTVGIRGTTDGDLIDQDTSIPSGECVRLAVDAVCDLFGVESGQATDPVEELAGQIESATREAIRQVCVDLADVVPSLDPLAVEQAMEVTAASRKVAAHVLGQEDRHVDQ